MAGVRRVAPENLAFKRGGRGRTLTVAAPSERLVPPAPRGIGKVARQVWQDFWRSPVSAAVDLDADQYAVRRWILAIDEREELLAEVRTQRVVTGSKGQLVLNPLYRRIDELTREIEKAEERFGITPQSRFRLQINVVDLDEKRQRLEDTKRREEQAPEEATNVIEGEVVDLDALG